MPVIVGTLTGRSPQTDAAPQEMGTLGGSQRLPSTDHLPFHSISFFGEGVEAMLSV
jgi:hypothetical protein